MEECDEKVDSGNYPENVTLLVENERKKAKVTEVEKGHEQNVEDKHSKAESADDPALTKLLASPSSPMSPDCRDGIVNNNKDYNPIKDEIVQEGLNQQKGFKRFLGILLAVLAALNFSLSALVIKILNYHPFNLGVWRFGIMTLVPIPILLYDKYMKKKVIWDPSCPFKSTTIFLILQAILGANSIVFVFFGLRYLNIADSIVIGTSAPVFVTLFAFIFLGESCGFVPFVTAILALVGVGIISKPPLLTGAESLNDDTMMGVASSFSSMILLTICYIVIRYLRKVHHALINFFFALWGLLQCIVTAHFTGELDAPKSYQEAGLIIVTAMLAFFAQTCLTLALKYEQAGPVALVRTTEVVFAFAWQAVFLGVQADMFSVIGAVVTLSGVILTALRKMVMSLPDGHKYKSKFRFLLW